VFGPLQLSAWTLIVEPNGPAILDLSYQWVFDEVEDPGLVVVGTRVIPWPIVPDWGDGIRERIAFLTDVLTSDTGAEQRRALRIGPRRYLKAKAYVEGRERALFDNMLHGWAANVWSFPLWHDIQVLAADLPAGSLTINCDTEYRDFAVGGYAMLRGEAARYSEVVEITAVDAASVTLNRPTINDWPRGSRLYPARPGRLERMPDIRRVHDRAWEVNFELRIEAFTDWAEATFPVTYRSHPVYEVRPDETEELDVSFERRLHVLDVEVAPQFVYDSAGEPFPLQLHRWVMHGAAERDAVRRLFYAMRGRQVSLWVPTHAEDLILAATLASSSTILTVEHTGFTLFGVGRVGKRDLRIELKDGTVFYRQVLGASELDVENETVTIDSALGLNVELDDVSRISFMRLMRADSDEIEIHHETDILGTATARLLMRALRDEL
jgi:hypothetical protein